MKKIFFLMLLLSFDVWAYKERKTPTGYFLVLKQGEDVLRTLEKVMEEKKINSGSFSGQGFVEAEFGFFKRDKKVYESKSFPGMELASFTGSMGREGDKPSIHAHGVVTDEKFEAYGGHILKARVGTGSLEITVIEHKGKFERKMDEKLGAKVLDPDP